MLTVWDWLRNSIFQIQQQQIIPQASCWNKKRSFGGYVRRFGNQAHEDLHDLESSKMLLALLETKVWLNSSVGDECPRVIFLKILFCFENSKAYTKYYRVRQQSRYAFFANFGKYFVYCELVKTSKSELSDVLVPS